MTVSFAPDSKDDTFEGPTFLATLLYVTVFALAVPACGMSRRFFSRRRRNSRGGGGGGASANSGSGGGTLSDGGGGGVKRRGAWRSPLGGVVRAGMRGGDEKDLQEMVPLAGGEGEEEGDWSRRDRVRV